MTVTVITGAASGMGRVCVERLRGTTEHLVAVDLRAPDIEGVVGVACDVADPGAVGLLVEKVEGLGPFRALAHAAGVSPTMAAARRVLEVDLVGTARCSMPSNRWSGPVRPPCASPPAPPTRSPSGESTPTSKPWCPILVLRGSSTAPPLACPTAVWPMPGPSAASWRWPLRPR